MFEVGLRGFNLEMVVMAHQAGDVAAPRLVLNVTAQEPHKLLSVRLIQKDGLLGIAARREVGEGTGKLQPKRTSHAARRESGPGTKSRTDPAARPP